MPDSVVIPDEIEVARLLHEKLRRHTDRLRHIIGRTNIEHLDHGHLYRYLSAWMARQFADVGLNATGGKPLPAPLCFAIVDGTSAIGNAHTFDIGPYTAILFERALVDHMWNLSKTFVMSNPGLVSVQWAPGSNLNDVMHLMTLMQACIVSSHEFSHIAREHKAEGRDENKVLFRAEEIEADNYGLYLDLPFFFSADGSNIASLMFGMKGKALENSIFECFLASIMLVFCSRWSRNSDPENLAEIDYPPPVLRLDYAARVLEMWCREIGKLPTVWQTDGTLPRLFADVIKLFPNEMKVS
jgi:hypothetical protein